MERVTTRGRPKGSRGRGKGKRGRKPRQIVSDEEENNVETIVNNEQEDPVASVNQEDTQTSAIESKSPVHEIAEGDVSISEADHEDELELEAPSFTTVQRNVPQVMLRLNWDHKVNLIGEKILNPMIYCCDQCVKPILVYGRMIPCKHVFCLTCARTEAVKKQCPRCKDKVVRVEETRLGTVHMCTHGGSRYGTAGCRRTYLSQRDLQAHINHRHVMAPMPLQDDIKALTDKQLSTAASIDQQSQQQPPSINNSHLRKDSLNSSSTSSSLFPSRIVNDNNHQHSHYQQQQLTPTKKSYLSQDNNMHGGGGGGFYNSQFSSGNNNFGAGSSSTQNSNNFYQQQSYHHQNFNNNYSQQQGQHQPQNQHHQQPQNWNQYYR